MKHNERVGEFFNSTISPTEQLRGEQLNSGV